MMLPFDELFNMIGSHFSSPTLGFDRGRSVSDNIQNIVNLLKGC